jgi:parallel beta-helix repeat protein
VSDLRIEGISIKDTPGNAIKVLGVTGVTFRNVGVSWTAGDGTDGAYGLYPVQSTNVLIEHCKISGASDSGIYVGQSKSVVVRSNEAFGNVAGIEIENSFDADVHDNNSHDNTAGILVFDLPGLQQEGGHSIRVFANTMTHNNTTNFAASGDIVSMVPAGVGFFVMANHDVEVFGNTFKDNDTAAAGIVSYAITQLPVNDAKYYQWPSKAYVHDNTYSGNGLHPDVHTQIGLLLLTGTSAYPQGHVPDVFWDGIVDPAAPAGADPMELCIGETNATVCNGHLDKLDQANPDVSKTVACDAAPFACTRPALPAVTWPGLTP